MSLKPTIKRNDTPLLSIFIGIGVVLGILPALYILSTRWSDSPQRLVAAGAAILSIVLFTVLRKKYEVLLIALLFFSQFQISLVSIPLNKPAILQVFFTDIILLLFIVAAIERRESFLPDLVGWLLFGLIVWQTVAAISFSAHLHRSLIFILWQVKYLLVYLLVRNFPLSEKLAQQIEKAIFIVLSIQGVLATAQLITGNTLGLVVFGEQDPSSLFYVKDSLRVSGTIGATNAFAGYLAMLLTFTLPFLFRWKGTFRYACYGIGFASLLFALSRAAWLSFMVGGVLVVIGVLRAGLMKPTRVMAIGLVGTTFIAVGALLYFDRIQERFEDKAAVDSAMGRFYQYEQVWPIIERYPVFGIGAGVTEYFGAWNDNKKYVHKELPDVKLRNQPHSSQLQYWIESGTPGFIIFILIFGMVFITAFKKRDDGNNINKSLLQIGAGAAAVTAMVHASFGTEINNHQMSIVFWIFFALARNWTKQSLPRFYLTHKERNEDFIQLY